MIFAAHLLTSRCTFPRGRRGTDEVQRLRCFLLLFLHPDGGFDESLFFFFLHRRCFPSTSHNLNAVSHTVLPLSQMDHDPRNPTYISSQGPLPTTVADFWQVILPPFTVVFHLLLTSCYKDEGLAEQKLVCTMSVFLI